MAKKFSEVVQDIREVKEPTGKLKDACWKGYTAVGMKMKDGRKVPNCVPVGEQFASDKPEPGREAQDGRFVPQPSKSVTKPAPQASPRNEEVEKDKNEYDYEGDMLKSDLRSIIANSNRIIDMVKDADNLPEWCQSKITLAEDYVSTVANYLTAEMNEDVEVDEMAGANMDTRTVHKHLQKSGWNLDRTKGGHDIYTHPKSSERIAVPRHRQLKAPLILGIMKTAKKVSEEVDQIDEISQQTKQSYIQKAKDQVKELEPHAKSGEYRDIAKNMMKRREAGIKKAEVTESRGHKIIATKLAQIEARRKQEQEIAKRAEEERKKAETAKPVKEADEKASWQKETEWKKNKDVVDKSGAKHSAMSRAKHLAKMASKKKVLEQDQNDKGDNIETPAKKTLAYRGVVKNAPEKIKGKKMSSDDKFEPEPELNTQIMRNSF
jgi:predicted RNA binding protein YcfA (HicA-like mRNA interferase family)